MKDQAQTAGPPERTKQKGQKYFLEMNFLRSSEVCYRSLMVVCCFC